jgi:DNA-binding PadR family transcriptional regulator
MMTERGRRGGGPWHHGGEGFGPGFGPRRGGRRRRGEIRTAVLAILEEGPAHGYEIIQTLEERSGGLWRPSPGSVYPLLQLLEDEGLVHATERDGKRVFELTATGSEEATTRLRDAGSAPWEQDPGTQGQIGLRVAFKGVVGAFKQVAMTGTGDQVERATGILNRARKELYQLLAED